MKFEDAILVLGVVGIILLLILAVLSGGENKACRERGGVPVKTTNGYECLKKEKA
jgi:hypothetical protein